MDESSSASDKTVSDDTQALKDSAFRLLTRREHSRFELRQKLVKKAGRAQRLQSCLTGCRLRGGRAMNDLRRALFATNLCRAKDVKNRGAGHTTARYCANWLSSSGTARRTGAVVAAPRTRKNLVTRHRRIANSGQSACATCSKKASMAMRFSPYSANSNARRGFRFVII